MSFLIGQIISLVRLLHSENGANQIASGLTIGFLIGLSPLVSLQGAILVLLLLILRVQIGAAIALAGLTKFLAILITPVLSSIGEIVLSSSLLRPIFTQLYNLPIVPYTKFNHSVVMGGLVASILLSPLLYFFFTKVIRRYQHKVVSKIKETKLFKAIRASSLAQWYLKYENLSR